MIESQEVLRAIVGSSVLVALFIAAALWIMFKK